MNVIILTTGISGSSVLTGFLAKSGFWTGDETVYKDNITGKYETYENKMLVDLNDTLISEVGLNFEGKARYDTGARDKFNEIYSQNDASKYQDFLEQCNIHSPWIWKDPRLFLTIGFWKNILDLNEIKVVVIYRNSYELWKSQTNKRIIYSYRFLKNSEEKTRKELLDYLESSNFSFVSLEYDHFTKNPEVSIESLNDFLGTTLSKGNWDQIYNPPSKFSGYKRALLAYLIYLKNFRDRIK